MMPAAPHEVVLQTFSGTWTEIIKEYDFPSPFVLVGQWQLRLLRKNLQPICEY
jgi:hypothetical protein